MRARQFGDPEKGIWEENQRTGESVKSICRRLGYNPGTISSRLVRAGRAARLNRVTYDHTYFRTIDTPDKAYVLGFICADGCVYVKGRSSMCRITQTASDRSLLEEIRDRIAPNGKVLEFVPISRYPNTQIAACLNLYSKQIPQDLIRLGCTSNKSASLRLPTKDQVPSRLMSHFLRGYFDGDGSISYGNYEPGKRRPIAQIGFSTSKTFCEDLQGWLRDTLDIGSCFYTKKGNRTNAGFSLKICGNKQVTTFMDYIYRDSPSIWLKRKREKYAMFLSLYRPSLPSCASELSVDVGQ